MKEQVIVSLEPGPPFIARHYVVEPTGDAGAGQYIGSMFVAGYVKVAFMTYSEAEQYVKDHKKEGEEA